MTEYHVPGTDYALPPPPPQITSRHLWWLVTRSFQASCDNAFYRLRFNCAVLKEITETRISLHSKLTREK